MLAAGVAVSLVWLVGASGEDPALEAVPAAMAVRDLAPPAPGADRQARDAVREAFGEEFADPLAEEIVLPGDEFLTFDPYNAPTPIVIQPDGATDEGILVPLPTAPATIAVAEVEAVGVEKKGALLSQPVKGRSTSRFGMRYHPILRVYKSCTPAMTGPPRAAPPSARLRTAPSYGRAGPAATASRSRSTTAPSVVSAWSPRTTTSPPLA